MAYLLPTCPRSSKEMQELVLSWKLTSQTYILIIVILDIFNFKMYVWFTFSFPKERLTRMLEKKRNPF